MTLPFWDSFYPLPFALGQDMKYRIHSNSLTIMLFGSLSADIIYEWPLRGNYARLVIKRNARECGEFRRIANWALKFVNGWRRRNAACLGEIAPCNGV